VPSSDLERFLALVRRELGALETSVVDAGEAEGDAEPTAATNELRSDLGDGRAVVARFDAEPSDRETKQRRLDMLASTFDVVADEAEHETKSRPPVARSLRDELTAVCARAAAVNVFVIDANSPIVWGAAHPEGVATEPPAMSSPRLAEANTSEEAGEPEVAVLSRRALHWVRGMPILADLRKGKYVRHVQRDAPVPLLAHSFAGIYVVVLVYAAPFDELRAERALAEAIPRIERLVLALPPLDPAPSDGAGVIAMRRPRRR
jgi:hypothetical protein